jgi:hypothetical protein
MTCSELAAGEPLAGTATRGDRFLLLEYRGAWAHDALESGLPEELRAAAQAFEGRVLLMRRGGDTEAGTAAFAARVSEDGGELRRLETLDRPGDSDNGLHVAGPLLLVCTHGRRDPCCLRLGTPVYQALRRHAGPDHVWRSSHHGGHRFAPNVLVLPAGIQLGRVATADAARVSALLSEGRIPLDRYRGRTLYAPPVQAAEVELRRQLGLDGVDDLRLVGEDGAHVTFATPDGEARVSVTETEGPASPPSCGAEPEPTRRFAVRLESPA